MVDVQNLIPEYLNSVILSLEKKCNEIYLVGGAIRNCLLGDPVQDFDFVVNRHSILAAKTMANALNGAFYILDHERETARCIITIENKKVHVDFSLINGNCIDQDLHNRDFTINAIAMSFPVNKNSTLYDPLNGIGDLESSLLKPCSETSFTDDPVRTIRAVRFAAEYHLTIFKKTEELISGAAKHLNQISPERQRDELLKVFEKTPLSRSLSLLVELDIFSEVFPIISQLQSISLSPPHTYDALTHTFKVTQYADELCVPFMEAPIVSITHPRISSAHNYLKRHHEHLTYLFTARKNQDRSFFSLLILAALFHDSGKAVVKSIDDQGRKRFPNHAKASSEIAENWAREHGFSKPEMKFIKNLVRHHMKPSKMGIPYGISGDLKLYRFFKKTGDSGVWVALLHLADVLATYEEGLTDARWEIALQNTDKIMDAYLNKYEQIVEPVRLLNGNEISAIIGGESGEIIGRILRKLAEAQVAGEITSKSDAKNFVKKNYFGNK